MRAAMLTRTRATYRTWSNHILPSRLNIADSGGAPAPPGREERLARLSGELEALGFERLTTVGPADASVPGTTYARVLVHREDAIRAWAIDMARGDIVNTYLELTSEWEDGTVVSTVTYTSASIFEPLPRLRQVKVPGADAATALAAHREACAEVPGPRLDPAARDAVEVAQEQNREVLDHQVACGILRRQDADYKFALRGAARSVRRVSRTMA